MVAPPAERATEVQNIGTLWCMPKSPYSTPVRAVLHLSGRTATEVAFMPILSSIAMFFRLGFRTGNKKITAPILQTSKKPSHYLRDSLEIAMYVDAARLPSRPTLFPADSLETIREFAAHAQHLNHFTRARMIALLQRDMHAAEALFVPRALRGRFFTRALVRVALFLFARKYAPESGAASRRAAREGLEALRARLVSYPGASLRYVCGGRLTYADVVIAESISFDAERHSRYAHIFVDEEFQEAFPDLIAWGRAVRATHYPAVVARRKTAS